MLHCEIGRHLPRADMRVTPHSEAELGQLYCTYKAQLQPKNQKESQHESIFDDSSHKQR